MDDGRGIKQREPRINIQVFGELERRQRKKIQRRPQSQCGQLTEKEHGPQSRVNSRKICKFGFHPFKRRGQESSRVSHEKRFRHRNQDQGGRGKAAQQHRAFAHQHHELAQQQTLVRRQSPRARR
jgi:hypothetical protein